jgi:hypothetical protein
MEKGLRQGDPLSPFLFNMVVEILSCMFCKAKQLGMVKGAVFGDGVVQISHLQFVDDTILFLEPKVEYIRNAKRILRCFELISGLKINFHKSCLVRIGKKGLEKRIGGNFSMFGVNSPDFVFGPSFWWQSE